VPRQHAREAHVPGPSELRETTRPQERYIAARCPALAALPTNSGVFLPGLARPAYAAFRKACFKLEYIYLLSTPHWLAWMDDWIAWCGLDRLMVGKHKFEAYRLWSKRHFAEFFFDTLLNPGADYGLFFDKATVANMLRQHSAGTRNYANELNKVLTTELIYASLIRA
jgi:hypothetical protein